jgi:hypothetical protein
MSFSVISFFHITGYTHKMSENTGNIFKLVPVLNIVYFVQHFADLQLWPSSTKHLPKVNKFHLEQNMKYHIQ